MQKKEERSAERKKSRMNNPWISKRFDWILQKINFYSSLGLVLEPSVSMVMRRRWEANFVDQPAVTDPLLSRFHFIKSSHNYYNKLIDTFGQT